MGVHVVYCYSHEGVDDLVVVVVVVQLAGTGTGTVWKQATNEQFAVGICSQLLSCGDAGCQQLLEQWKKREISSRAVRAIGISALRQQAQSRPVSAFTHPSISTSTTTTSAHFAL